MSNENEKSTAPKPIDLTDLIDRFVRVFKRFWFVILIFAAVIGAVFSIMTVRSFTPMYESQALFSVNSGYTADDIFTASYYDNEAAQQLAAAFPNMLKTDIMRELIMENIGKSSINGTISPSAVADTNMFTLTVRSSSPEDAYEILWAVIECYPQVAVYMVDNPQVIIREEPTVAAAPYNSLSIKTPLVNGALIGAAIAVVLLAIIAIFSKTVTNAEHLKNLVNIPIYSVLPKVEKKKRRKNSATQTAMIYTDDGLAESMKGLSLKLQKQLEDESQKIILVTSTLAGEGKTTVSVNLALTMASEGLRVCLVDADFRKQSIAMQLGFEPGKYSMLDCIKNSEIPVSKALRTIQGTTLSVISGESIGARHYKIDAKETSRVVDSLLERFDYIIMDTSPFAIVADTALLCRHAKCVLYAVKPDYARQSQILDCVTSLYDRGIAVSGFILNGVPRTNGHYGYGYKYGYGYGYKYGYGYGRYGYGYGYGYGSKKKAKKRSLKKNETEE